jgi:D-alanine transaminase
MIAYYNGQFLEKSKIAVSPDDRGFLFADGVYEVIRSYQGRLFECEEHLKRLEYGLEELRITGVNIADINKAMHRLLADNQLSDATIYIQVTRGSAPRSHRFPPSSVPPTVYLDANPLPPTTPQHTDGAAAILVPDQRWSRCDIKTVGLLANVLAKQRASESGAFEALLVRDGAVLEGSSSNLFFVRNDFLITAPLSNYILAGITRRVVLGLAETLGIPIRLQPCFEHELRKVEEMFVAGTTSEVTPIVRVGQQPVGQGVEGPITRLLREEFQRLTKQGGTDQTLGGTAAAGDEL